MDEHQLRQDIVEVCRRIWLKGFVAANDGNVSARLDENSVIVTPTGFSKGFLSPDMLIKIDLDGNRIEGSYTPSSEIPLHLRVYHKRPDVNAVVHAHPPTATGFSVAGIPLDRCILPEVIISMGSIPIVEYGTPSTSELPDNLDKYIMDYDAFLLENHGALTVGTDVYRAYFKMEAMELYSQILFTALMLGGAKVLSREDLRKLEAVRESFGVPGKYPGCITCEFGELKARKDAGSLSDLSAEQLAELIATVIAKVLRK